MQSKIYAATIILAFMFSCCVGYSTYTYVGPYEVSFNSSAHSVSFITLEPYFTLFKNKDDQWDVTSNYKGFSLLNNSTTTITIAETP